MNRGFGKFGLMKVALLQSLTALPILVAQENRYFQEFGLKVEIQFRSLLDQIEKKLETGIKECGEVSFVSILKRTESLGWKSMPFYPGCILSYCRPAFYSTRGLREEAIWRRDQDQSFFIPVSHYQSIERYYAETIIKRYFPNQIEPVAISQIPSNLMQDVFYSRNCFGLTGDLLMYPFLQRAGNPYHLAGNFILPNTIIAFNREFLDSSPEKAALFLRAIKKGSEFLQNSNAKEVYSIILRLFEKNIYLPFCTEDILLALTNSQGSFKDVFYPSFRREYYKSLVELVTPKQLVQAEYLQYIDLFEKGMEKIFEGSFPYDRDEEAQTKKEEKTIHIYEETQNGFSSGMYRALFKESPELLLIFRDIDLGIVDANIKFCQETGYTTSELNKMSVASLFSRFDKDNPVFEYTKRNVDVKYISNQEIFHRNGMLLNVDMYINVYQQGSEKQYLVTFINNTEKKETMRLKHEFISNISHELRSPMTNIKGYFELLSSDTSLTFSKEHRDSLDAVFRNIKRMNKLIDNLLQLGKSTSVIDRHMEVFDPSGVIDEVIFINESMAKDKNIEIKKELKQGLLIDGNKFDFSQVVTNLLVNAVKYTVQGSVVVSCSRADNNLCQVKFTDTGIGIDSKYHLSIFERFFRVPDMANRKVGGTGIGLAISQEIISKMGGVITVESTVGKGSVFTILVPLVN
jgi:PAS domain S-box-containing protein